MFEEESKTFRFNEGGMTLSCETQLIQSTDKQHLLQKTRIGRAQKERRLDLCVMRLPMPRKAQDLSISARDAPKPTTNSHVEKGRHHRPRLILRPARAQLIDIVFLFSIDLSIKTFMILLKKNPTPSVCQ